MPGRRPPRPGKASLYAKISVHKNKALKPEKKMKKFYILDTNVLIHDPLSFTKFEDNTVVIPISVIEELDTFKNAGDERGRSARAAGG